MLGAADGMDVGTSVLWHMFLVLSQIWRQQCRFALHRRPVA
jgi:hypothetical protein